MRVVHFIGDRHSSKGIRAIVEVDAGEKADIEEMKRLLDGESGHFGLTARLVASGALPGDALTQDFRGDWKVKTQFGFDAGVAKGSVKRFYDVRVERD